MEDEIQQFCADLLELFCPKENKQPVQCAIGSADSGKTSLFAPIFQIVPLSRIDNIRILTVGLELAGNRG